MIEPTQEEVYRLCGIEQPGWCMDPKERGQYVGRDPEPSGALVALRWIKLLSGADVICWRDGEYSVYETGPSTLRVKVS